MSNSQAPDKQTGGWLWFVAGPTASGKSSIAKGLAEALNFTYIEGDDFHPPSNVKKMSAGVGLTDDDRREWLSNLQDVCSRRYEEGSTHMAVSASALKRHYRDKLRQISQRSGGLRVRFVFLDVPEDVLHDRAAKRHGHFAGRNLVHSQMEALEEPDKDETDVVRVDANESEDLVSREVAGKVAEAMKLEKANNS